MAMYLTEITTSTDQREDIESMLAALESAVVQAGGSLLEVQVSQDLGRIFFVCLDIEPDALAAAVSGIGAEQSAPAAVRLVGSTVEEVRGQPGGAASHLVEWDFPAGLDMDSYLTRKKEKAPLYGQVPEVSFLRTYVREDMAKCLCLYDAPDAQAVVRAREAVSTPIDRLHQLADGVDVSTASRA